MKFNKIAMLVASGMMMASVGGTSLANTSSGLSGESTINATVSEYAVLNVLNNIEFGELSLNADKEFSSTGTAEICVAVANNNTREVTLWSKPTAASSVITHASTTPEVISWGPYDQFVMTASLPKLKRSETDGTNYLDVLNYQAVLGSNRRAASAQPGENKNLAVCTDSVSFFRVTIDDSHISQNPGAYAAEITLSIMAT